MRALLRYRNVMKFTKMKKKKKKMQMRQILVKSRIIFYHYIQRSVVQDEVILW